MGIHYVEETHFDEGGNKTRKIKHPVAGSAAPIGGAGIAGAEDEAEDIGGTSKSRDKYKLPQFKIPNRCTVCDGALVMGGPIWNGKIQNIDFVKRLMESVRQS